MLCDVSSAANVRRESTVGNGKWDRGVGREVLLKLGRCSIDQEPCVKNLSFVRRQGWGVISKVGGRWKGFSPEGGNPCSD